MPGASIQRVLTEVGWMNENPAQSPVFLQGGETTGKLQLPDTVPGAGAEKP